MGCTSSKDATQLKTNQPVEAKPSAPVIKQNKEKKIDEPKKETVGAEVKAKEDEKIKKEDAGDLEQKRKEDEEAKKIQEAKLKAEEDEKRKIQESEKKAKDEEAEEFRIQALVKEQQKNSDESRTDDSKSAPPTDDREAFGDDIEFENGKYDAPVAVEDEETPATNEIDASIQNQPQPVEETYVTILPIVGFVIKSKRPDGSKVFINIFHHEQLRNMISTPAKTSIDRQGNDCLAYSVVIPYSLYQNCIEDEIIRDTLCKEAITLVNDAYSDTLGFSYVVPKMKKGYIGDSIESLEVSSKMLLFEKKDGNNLSEEKGNEWRYSANTRPQSDKQDMTF